MQGCVPGCVQGSVEGSFCVVRENCGGGLFRAYVGPLRKGEFSNGFARYCKTYTVVCNLTERSSQLDLLQYRTECTAPMLECKANLHSWISDY